MAAEIQLTQGQIAIVDECDLPLVEQFKWQVSGCYARRTFRFPNGKQESVHMHRLILGLTPGDGLEVDHVNHDRLDNRRSNLRIVRRAGQAQNMSSQRGSSSRYRGVYWHRRSGKWAAEIHTGERRIYCGVFDSEVEAAETALLMRLELMPFAEDGEASREQPRWLTSTLVQAKGACNG